MANADFIEDFTNFGTLFKTFDTTDNPDIGV